MTNEIKEEIKDILIRFGVVGSLIACCLLMILISKYHNQIVALEKEKDELVIAIEEKSATTQQNEPTRYELASEVYNVDKYLLEAIERLETGHFTSDVFKENNNAYGGVIDGEYLSYDSHYQSTMELARLLRFDFYNKGITDLHEIGEIYCPDDELWADKVIDIYNSLKEKR